MAELERLAQLDRPAELPEETLAAVADLVLRLHQRRSRAHGAILTPRMRVPYAERSETERLGMRSAVQHVLDALILLEVVDLQDVNGAGLARRTLPK